jgi:hypothetical protein
MSEPTITFGIFSKITPPNKRDQRDTIIDVS